MTRLFLMLIVSWQRGVSRWLPPMCRFYPSCSRYTAEAITEWGPWAGAWLGFQRILRCQPFHPGGFDPVPMRPAGPDEEIP